MTVWLERLRPDDVQIMLPEVLVALERIRDQPMDPERRLSRLRALKDQVEPILAATPVRRPGEGVGDRIDPGPTPTQRLTRAWCENLQHLLEDLGRPRYARSARFRVYREWVLRQLLKGFEQGIECAAQAARPPSPGTWKSLHALFVYLEGRGEIEVGVPMAGQRFHPGLTYRRLLLLGTIGDYANAARMLREIGPRLGHWAATSMLRPADGYLHEGRLLWIDVGADRPPSWRPRSIDASYRGWVLDPPRAFSEYLEPYEIMRTRPFASESSAS